MPSRHRERRTRPPGCRTRWRVLPSAAFAPPPTNGRPGKPHEKTAHTRTAAQPWLCCAGWVRPPIHARRRSGLDGLPLQMTPHVVCKIGHCGIAPRAVLSTARMTIRSGHPAGACTVATGGAPHLRYGSASGPSVEMRVLGFGGSYSRMSRQLSTAARSRWVAATGVARVGGSSAGRRPVHVCSRVHVHSLDAACSGLMYDDVPIA